jgi:HPt (histidine-containing phosphotransfer) domain-containing protein
MNPDFLIELIETFIAQAPAQIVELSAAVQQRKYETAARIAHKTKSMFAYLKLGKSVKRIRQIEAQTLEAVSADRILQSIEKLESETAQSIYEMNVVLAKLKML